MKTRIIEPTHEPTKRYIPKPGDFFTYNDSTVVLLRVQDREQLKGWDLQHVDLRYHTIFHFSDCSQRFQKLKLVGVDGDGTMIFERETQ